MKQLHTFQTTILLKQVLLAFFMAVLHTSTLFQQHCKCCVHAQGVILELFLIV